MSAPYPHLYYKLKNVVNQLQADKQTLEDLKKDLHVLGIRLDATAAMLIKVCREIQAETHAKR